MNVVKPLMALVLFATAPLEAADVRVSDFHLDGLVGEIYEPVGAARRPALLLGGSEGGIPWHNARDQVGQLADRGFLVLALAYFGSPDLPSSLQSIPLEYFDQAIAWLHSDSGGQCVALIGGSKGAEAALLLASNNEDICVVAAIAPSAYVFQGIGDATSSTAPRSSWSRNGVDVPFAAFVDNATRRRAIENWAEMRFIDVYRDAIQNPRTPTEARIPVERIRGPILLLSGRNDVLWPSREMGEVVMQSLATHPYEHRHRVYDAGHSVGALSEAWRSMIEFIDTQYP